MNRILNVAAYRFVPLASLPELRERLHTRASQTRLKGTVLLAEEGINLFLAGEPVALRGFMDELLADAHFAGMPCKFSDSGTIPFKKLLVKIKHEIIRMNHPQIKPAVSRAAAVQPATLKRWLDAGCDDEGREVVTLDTRNAFEVSYGTFNGTQQFGISKFTEFPRAIADHRNDWAGKTVVTFCTGGIRCEKAALYMQELGMSHVYQLDGGILKYFEEVGHAHYTGTCFVFDERESLDSELKPSTNPVQA
jgi:UPF0176 protein